ncbi:hypothetical protein A176_005504 [Myxococcus hansupus]|uniref:Lipoprotein n=1 Tax=Pseudomyxococcus hansupus TaxID=1297742 RepID=A0A0H4XK33_9BACT|nr:hypothetical protein [Myxococcus hansupus]AKQ68592.1 hypothetical protein A176_005504 [Myxococcus hansupus]
MRAAALSFCLLFCVPGVASAQAERSSKLVPSLAKPPRIQGGLKAFTSPLVLKPVATEGATASFTAKVGARKDTLYVGVEATDDQLQAGDLLTLSLYFPNTGPTSTGYTWRFAFDGKRASGANSGTPQFAQDLVTAAVQRQGNTLLLMASVPVRAFPRFPAVDPLVFDLCLTYEDRDSAEAKVTSISNCQSGTMVGDALRLSDEPRKGLKLKPPETVTALEPRQDGWLGWDYMSYPAWAQGDDALTPASLRSLVAPEAVNPSTVDLNVPDTLSLPDDGRIVTVVSGKNPYAVAGQCDADDELRLGFYHVTGKTARRVLEWPAATCALGRTSSVELDEEGVLSIRYSNGTSMNFAWSGTHFSRTELGKR